MCLHNSMSMGAAAIGARYAREVDLISDYEPVYHISALSNPLHPVVTARQEIERYRWGLIPSWVRTEEDAFQMRRTTYNAPSETIFDKASFRGPIASRRCIVPSTGWFAWRVDNERKIPYFVSVRDEDIFSMAAIYDQWHNPHDGTLWHTFSIVTTAANDLLSYIDNARARMPVILSPGEEERWLDPTLGRGQVEAMMRQIDSRRLDSYVVDTDFTRLNPRNPAILERA